MSLSELRERVSSAEMAAWMAFNRVEPVGEFRADFRTAMVLQQTANMNRDRTRQPDPYQVKDFMPFLPEEPKKDLSGQEFAEKWKRLFKR